MYRSLASILFNAAALSAVAFAQDPPASPYKHIKPSYRFDGDGWGDLKDVNVPGICDGSVSNTPLKPVWGGAIVPQCLTDETQVYLLNNTVLIESGTQHTSMSGLSATIYLSCLSNVDEGTPKAAHIFDLQIRNVTLFSGLTSGEAQKSPDSDFSRPFHVIRSLTGSIVGVQVDNNDKAEIVQIKKAIAENFQTQFVYAKGGPTLVEEKGVTASRNTKYYAVTDGNNRYAIRAEYGSGDVKKWSPGTGVDKNSVGLAARTNAMVDDKGRIRESIDRTDATLTANATPTPEDDTDINIHGGSDLVYIESVARIPTNQNGRLSGIQSTRSDKNKRSELPVQISYITTSDGTTLTVPALASGHSRFGRRVAGEPAEMKTEDLTSTFDLAKIRQEYNVEELIHELSQVPHDTNAASQLVRLARSDMSAGTSLLGSALHRRAQDNPDVANAYFAALAASGNEDAHHHLVNVIQKRDATADIARNALVYARDPSLSIVDRVASMEGNVDVLLLASLLEHQPADVARQYMEPYITRLPDESSSDADKIRILLAVGNMGKNAQVVLNEVLSLANDENTSPEVRQAATEALSAIISPNPHSSTTLLKRASISTDWDAKDSGHDMLADQASRSSDVSKYASHRSFVTSQLVGWKMFNIEMAAGAFAGSQFESCVSGDKKVMARTRGVARAFGKSAEIADVHAFAIKDKEDGIQALAYLKLAGKTIVEKSFAKECLAGAVPLASAKSPILPITFGFPIYVITVDVGIELSGGVAADLVYELCGDGKAATIAVIPKVTGTVAGSAGVSVLGMRGGIELSGTTTLKLGPQARLEDNPEVVKTNASDVIKRSYAAQTNKPKKCRAKAQPSVPVSSDSTEQTLNQIAPGYGSSDEHRSGPETGPSYSPYYGSPKEQMPASKAPGYESDGYGPEKVSTHQPPYESADEQTPVNTRLPTSNASAGYGVTFEAEPIYHVSRSKTLLKTTTAVGQETPSAYEASPIGKPFYTKAAYQTASIAKPSVTNVPGTTATYSTSPVQSASSAVQTNVGTTHQKSASSTASPGLTSTKDVPSSKPGYATPVSSIAVTSTDIPSVSTGTYRTMAVTSAGFETSTSKGTYATLTISKPGYPAPITTKVAYISKDVYATANSTASMPAFTSTKDVYATPSTSAVSKTGTSTSASTIGSTTTVSTIESATTTTTATATIVEPTTTVVSTTTTLASTTSPSSTTTVATTTTSAPIATQTPKPPHKPLTPCQVCVSLNFGTENSAVELAGTFRVLFFKKHRKVFFRHDLGAKPFEPIPGANVCLAI